MGPPTRDTDEDLLHSGSNIPNMPDMGSADAQFFRVLSDNMKYVFNSPVPTKTQFPTPYSSNQLDSSQQQDPAIGINSMENDNVNTSFHRNPDSSFIDRTLNSHLYATNNNSGSGSSSSNSSNPSNININKNGVINDALQDINIQPSSALQFSAVESTAVKRLKPHSKPKTYLHNNNTNDNNNIASTNNNLSVPDHNNNNNNIQTDFLLPSPVQLREFLYDSPAGINFFHNTPARSPLRFLHDDSNNNNPGSNTNNNGPSSSNLMHLFNSVNDQDNNTNNNNNNNNDNSTNINAPDNNINNLTELWDRISTNTRTPLRKIDINLMFNNGQLLTNSNSMSPLKKLSMSLTPYGRRVLNDMGTPFNNNNSVMNNIHNNINHNDMVTSSGIKSTLLGSSNSALIDFQRARKDTTLDGPPILDSNNIKKSIVAMSPTVNNNSNSLDNTIGSPKLVITPKKSKGGRKKKSLNTDQIPKLQKTDNKNNRRVSNIDSRLENEDNDMDYDASSPTTIQLNSSVTKSLPKMNINASNKLIDRIPVLSRNMTMLEKNSMDITLSPTPRSNISIPMTTNNKTNNNNKLTFLPVPDLPKMGSFRSEHSASTLGVSDISVAPPTQAPNIASKLPSISSFPSTTILPPQTQSRKPIVKKKKVTKAKKPKFQIFVSSVHKFSDPKSSMQLSSTKSNSHSQTGNGNKPNKRGKKS